MDIRIAGIPVLRAMIGTCSCWFHPVWRVRLVHMTRTKNRSSFMFHDIYTLACIQTESKLANRHFLYIYYAGIGDDRINYSSQIACSFNSRRCKHCAGYISVTDIMMLYIRYVLVRCENVWYWWTWYVWRSYIEAYNRNLWPL